MIIRAGFLVVALVSAITVGQINLSRARKRSSSTDSKNGNACFHGGRIGEENSKFDESHDERREREEKVETCRSESVLEGISDKPEKTDCKMDECSVQENSVYEINHLKKVVKEMEQRRENPELELIELYCLKEQQSRIANLQKQLKDRMAEMDILRNMLSKLQSEREELYEEVKLNQLAGKQLESAKLTILELQLNMELDAGRLKGHLMRLEEQVSGFDVDGTLRKDTKSDKKIKAIREVELKAMKMKRRNKELQLEKRELGLKMDAAQARIAALSGIKEDIIVARIVEEGNRLKGVNHQLTEQVEELHKNRFSILEELVYQRRLNSCLRFELQDHYSPQPGNVCRKLTFQSEDESKASSLDPGTEISSTESEEITNTTINSSSNSPSVKSKKFGLIFNIKRWGRSSDYSSADAENNSLRRIPGLFRRFSMSSVPSSTSGQRDKGGRRAIFTVGKTEVRGSSSPEIPLTGRVRRVSFNDSLNSVAYTSDYSPRSVQGIQNNDHPVAESFSDWSDIKTSSSIAQEKKSDEMPLEGANVKQSMASGDLNNQDPHSNKIETQTEFKKEIVHTENLSPGKPPRTSKFCEHIVNLIAAFSFIIFLFLAYFTLLSRTRKFCSFGISAKS